MKTTRILIVFAMVLILTLGLVGSASAITFGEPDGNRHPNVGMLIFRNPGDGQLYRFVQVHSSHPAFT